MPTLINRRARPRLLIHGHHGVGNVGDDAMLRHAVDQLKASSPTVEITLSAGDMVDDAWCARHRIRLLARTRLSLLKALPFHDSLAIVGGTWIHSPVNTLRYDLVTASLAAFLMAARLARVKTAMVGIGIGPLEKPLGTTVAGLACRRARFISVRDPASWEWLKKLRLPLTETVLCADPAYGLTPTAVERKPFRLGISAMPYHAGYSRRPEQDSDIVDALTGVADDWLTKSSDHEVVLLPFNHKAGVDQDHNVLAPILRQHAHTGRIRMAGYTPDPSVTLHDVAGCGAMVAMRYHSVLFAHLAATPMVVLDYHGKTRALLEEVGFPRAACIAAKDVTPAALRPLVMELGRLPATHLATKPPEMFRHRLDQLWPSDLCHNP